MSRAKDDALTLPSAKRRDKLIMSLELRGMRQKQIAQVLGLQEMVVYNATQRASYQAEFLRRLSDVDDDFLKLKPKAVAAVSAALDSADERIGLSGAETWFKAMGYKGFGKGDPQADRSVTAEDIAARLLAAGGGRVTIDVQAQRHPTQGQETSPLLDAGRESGAMVGNRGDGA